jgi:DNA-binding CsgD family transcriptional regulator
MIESTALEASRIRTIGEYKAWTRERIRPILPHGTLASGSGVLNAGGVGLDYVLLIDYPVNHIDGIRNRAGGIDTPLLRRWIATREPQLFEADHPSPDVPASWLECFRAHGLRNAAAHGVYDTWRCVATYHSFHRIPGRLGAAHVEALKRLVPLMHETLCRVIGLLNQENKFAARFAALSPREKEVARWARIGKTNGEIASLSDLSENTVKHHMTSIFDKLAVESRAQLALRLVDHEANPPPGFGTRIL